jgi:transcription initiation factor TFIIIB Brf1 subunit/transcription initiation factor TFIIB|tara:strand:+ start:8840 stop:9793 length:954 start_codon:yes stop_codon:yes gene_type:complete
MELAAIWNQVDKLIKKENELKSVVNRNICSECDGVKVITPEGLPVCSSCGLVEDGFIDESAEWTSGIGEDGRVNDPSRCGNPNSNPELFSHAWGKGTVVSTSGPGRTSYEVKRMAKINFHMSMNHKDRSLFHAYRGIDEACYTLPETILRDAKMMYKKFDDSKLTRGAVRTGIKGNCVLYACRLAKVPRTTKEIADMFGIQSKDISRTTQIFKETIMGKTEKNYTTRPCDVVHRLLGKFNTTRNYRPICTKLCNEIEDCVELMSKTPNSIASAIILIMLKTECTKSEICSTCGVSVPTVNKIENIIKKHLEAKNVSY